jgi:hypothetical protein
LDKENSVLGYRAKTISLLAVEAASWGGIIGGSRDMPEVYIWRQEGT